MTDTSTIEIYYREHDPLKRKMFLDQSIAAGEDPQANAIRKELWDLRYNGHSQKGADVPADQYLALWMAMEFNKDVAGRFFGSKGARKEIMKKLEQLKFKELQEKGGLYKDLLYRECVHMVKTYMELCEKDKSYNTTLCGIVPMNEKSAKNKLQKDIYETAIELPEKINMEEELAIIKQAAKEAYEAHFPGEGGI